MDDYIKYCLFNEFDSRRIKFPKDPVKTELRKNEAQFSISGSEVTIERQNQADQLRLSFFKDITKQIIDHFKLVDLKFKGIISLGDEILDDSESRLCFARKRNSPHICIPDAHISMTMSICEHLPSLDIPIEEKINKGSFFGSDTGLKDENGQTQRSRFCHLYKNSKNIDAKITNFVQGDFDAEISSKYASKEDQLKYKYIFNINGNTTSWERLIWAMNSNSHCIFVKQPLYQDDLCWYYHIFNIKKCFIEIGENEAENLLECADDLKQDFELIKESQKKIGQMLANPYFHMAYYGSLLVNYNHAYNESFKYG